MKDNSNALKSLSFEEKKIFNLLQKNGCLPKNKISSRTDIKLTTLNYVMEPLEKSKMIVESCIGESTGGRRPILYDININDFYIIGIDISILYTQVVITNFKMEILYKELFNMDDSYTPCETVKKIVEIINRAYTNLNLSHMKLLGIGVGSVGPLDIKNGIIKNPVDFFADKWTDVPIKEMLEEKLKCPVVVENGANAAVVAEYFYGVGKGIENIAFFNCGIGIRTGTISSGHLIRTINDEEEAFGHMTIDIDGEQCKCGNYGCLECYSTIKAIIKNISRKIKKGRHTIINKPVEEIDYKDVCLAAEMGDELSVDIITDAALILGAGLSNYIKLLSPKLVILTGPLIINSKLFYNVCVKSTLKNLNSTKGKSVIFNRCGYFSGDAISIGASAMVIERCLESGI